MATTEIVHTWSDGSALTIGIGCDEDYPDAIAQVAHEALRTFAATMSIISAIPEVTE